MFSRRRAPFLRLLTLVALAGTFAARADAQQQERTLDERIHHPDSFAAGRDSFRTDSFTVKRAVAADREAAVADHTFATKTMPVRENPLAHKTTPYDRPYVTASKPYLIPGKRQDAIDELRTQKNLSVDDVRSILNRGTGLP